MTLHEVFDVPNLQPHEVGVWVDARLRQARGNVGLADGLRLAPRCWEASQRMPVHSLHRACGPEADMEYPEPAERWSARVEALTQAFKQGARFAPLIVQQRGGVLSVRDGNHRLGALERLGIPHAWVLIWSDEPA